MCRRILERQERHSQAACFQVARLEGQNMAHREVKSPWSDSNTAIMWAWLNKGEEEGLGSQKAMKGVQ